MKLKKFNCLVLIPVIFVTCLCLTILVMHSNCANYKKADKYLSTVLKYSHEHGVAPELVLAVINAESNFNKSAISSKGAIGLMQILPKTAAYIADICGFSEQIDLRDVDCNIALGCAYLCYLQKRFKGKNEVICAYNAGEGTVSNWLKNSSYSKDEIRLNRVAYKETRVYLKKVLNYEQKYRSYLQKKGYYAKGNE